MSPPTEQFGESLSPMARAVAAHRFTAGLNPDHLQKLLNVAMFREFQADEVIFSAGEPANRFYLVCQGKIVVESTGREESATMLQYVGPGEALGWSWLFPPYYWHFGARAVERTSALFFYGTRLREECDDDPAFGYEVMKRVAAVVIKRLQTVRLQLLRLQQESPNGPSI